MNRRRGMSEEERVEACGSDSWDAMGAFVGKEEKGESIMSISPELLRAAILQRAGKLCGEGKTPDTKCFADAEKSVKADLKKGGIKILSPGAKPGRVTK